MDFFSNPFSSQVGQRIGMFVSEFGVILTEPWCQESSKKIFFNLFHFGCGC